MFGLDLHDSEEALAALYHRSTIPGRQGQSLLGRGIFMKVNNLHVSSSEAKQFANAVSLKSAPYTDKVVSKGLKGGLVVMASIIGMFVLCGAFAVIYIILRVKRRQQALVQGHSYPKICRPEDVAAEEGASNRNACL